MKKIALYLFILVSLISQKPFGQPSLASNIQTEVLNHLPQQTANLALIWPVPETTDYNWQITGTYDHHERVYQGEYKNSTGNPIYGSVQQRFALDIGPIPSQIGAPVIAAEAGRISMIATNGNIPCGIVIDHNNGYASTYYHITPSVVQDEFVQKGQQIGSMTNCGTMDGIHVHWQLNSWSGDLPIPAIYPDQEDPRWQPVKFGMVCGLDLSLPANYPSDQLWLDSGSTIPVTPCSESLSNTSNERFGNIRPDGTFILKEGSIGASWVEQNISNASDYAIEGNRVVYLDNSGNLYGKEGSLESSNPYIQLDGTVIDFELTNNLIFALRSDGQLRVKANGLTDEWTLLADNVQSFSAGNGQVMILRNGAIEIKTNGLGDQWLPAASNVQDYATTANAHLYLTVDGHLFWDAGTGQQPTLLSDLVQSFSSEGNRVMIWHQNGNLYVKEGLPSGEWVQISNATAVTSYQLEANRVAWLDTNGNLFVREGPLTAVEILVADRVEQYYLDQNRIFILRNGVSEVKEGDLGAAWITFANTAFLPEQTPLVAVQPAIIVPAPSGVTTINPIGELNEFIISSPSGANLRQNPCIAATADCTILLHLEPQTNFFVMSQVEGEMVTGLGNIWFKSSYGGQTGYIHCALAQAVSSRDTVICTPPGGQDSDGDGIPGDIDNCPDNWNPDQADTDGDWYGDVCDSAVNTPPNSTPIPDADKDGIADQADNCFSVPNSDQADSDSDRIGNACDSTPNGNTTSPSSPDADGDGRPDNQDNCPSVANSDQANNYGDGRGDACEQVPVSQNPASTCGNSVCEAEEGKYKTCPADCASPYPNGMCNWNAGETPSTHPADCAASSIRDMSYLLPPGQITTPICVLNDQTADQYTIIGGSNLTFNLQVQSGSINFPASSLSGYWNGGEYRVYVIPTPGGGGGCYFLAISN